VVEDVTQRQQTGLRMQCEEEEEEELHRRSKFGHIWQRASKLQIALCVACCAAAGRMATVVTCWEKPLVPAGGWGGLFTEAVRNAALVLAWQRWH
jgi:hypothetical protein